MCNSFWDVETNISITLSWFHFHYCIICLLWGTTRWYNILLLIIFWNILEDSSHCTILLPYTYKWNLTQIEILIFSHLHYNTFFCHWWNKILNNVNNLCDEYQVFRKIPWGILGLTISYLYNYSVHICYQIHVPTSPPGILLITVWHLTLVASLLFLLFDEQQQSKFNVISSLRLKENNTFSI